MSRLLVCSYPKSGRTWLRFALANYIAATYELGDHVDFTSLFAFMPNSDDGLVETQAFQYANSGVPLIEWSHREFQEEYRGARIVFITRHPFDAIVSRYYHETKHWQNFSGTMSEYLRDPAIGARSYVRHLESWASQLGDLSHLLVTYEAMLDDMGAVLRSVIEWIGMPLVEAHVSAAVAASSFDAMRGEERTTGIPGHDYNREDTDALRVRRGGAGGWRNELSGEDVAYLESRMQTLSSDALHLLESAGYSMPNGTPSIRDRMRSGTIVALEAVKWRVRRLRRAVERRRAPEPELRALTPERASFVPADDLIDQRYDVKGDGRAQDLLIILSTPRSGSTLLCTWLNQQQHCVAHEYLETEYYLPLLCARWDCRGAQDEVLWPDFARQLERHRTGPNGVLGVNVHGAHIRQLLRLLPHFPDARTRYVWLRRRDQIGQAVSLGIAVQTGQWTSSFTRRAEPSYDFPFYRAQLRTIHEQEDLIAAFLRTRNLPYETVYYEDLVSTPGATLAKVALTDLTGGSGVPVATTNRQAGATNDAFVDMLSRDLVANSAAPLGVARRTLNVRHLLRPRT